MARHEDEPVHFGDIDERLRVEFAEVHAADTVARCVAAAAYGAQEIVGAAPPDLVERIARRHLQVLATIAAQKGRYTSHGNPS